MSFPYPKFPERRSSVQSLNETSFNTTLTQVITYILFDATKEAHHKIRYLTNNSCKKSYGKATIYTNVFVFQEHSSMRREVKVVYLPYHEFLSAVLYGNCITQLQQSAGYFSAAVHAVPTVLHNNTRIFDTDGQMGAGGA